ncbi:hypothetical protein AMATHDRAFT_6488 [Amanita thiersii Skay4041]|uniref:WW domain-containing protein n=1 Tax=Amanita thiersii Skay4041 TaxID=703135 RepID=A0A2A9NIX9_9AGAR|nr:hypothetical protein AMATHDRAFT_6488 [Amanita thiersii Skay4041]
MDEDTEVLDWGNEEDELTQDSHWKSSFQEADADDAVSLGEDEDDQPYYAQQVHEDIHGSTLSSNSGRDLDYDTVDRFGSNISRGISVDGSSQSQQERGDTNEGASNSRHFSPNESPGRSRPFLQPRLTHALPPKPIAASLPYISPSHPSIVEATAMSVRSREHKKNGQVGRASTGDDQLPPNWEIRYPRNGGREYYYYNVVTHQSTWTRPVSNIDSPLPESRGSKPRRRRGSSVSAGDRVLQSISLDSDHFNSQSVRSSRPPPPADPDKQSQHTSSMEPSALSYADRHYRPAENTDNRRNDRFSEAPDSKHVESELTPPGSPHHLERSVSPVSNLQLQPSDYRDRGSRQAHGPSHFDYDTDLKEETPDLSRDRDISGLDASAPPLTTARAPVDTGGDTNRESRYHQFSSGPIVVSTGDAREDRDRISLSRSQSSRGRGRKHDSPQSVAGRQQDQSQSLSTSRPRSPLPHRDREWIPAQREQEPIQQAISAATTSTKPEPTSQGGAPSLVPRQRDKPSRFDQPLVPPPPPVLSGTAPALPVVNERPLSRPREHDVYIPDNSKGNYQRPLNRDFNRERDELTMLTMSHQQIPVDRNDSIRPSYPNDRSYHDSHRAERPRAASITEFEDSVIASDQPGPSSRRKRLPLPPQSASFREGSGRRDTELLKPQPQPPPVRPPPPASPSFPSGPKDYQYSSNISSNMGNPGSASFAPRQVPPHVHVRGDPDIARRRHSTSFNGPQHPGTMVRDRPRNEKRVGHPSGYSQLQLPLAVDSHMDVDVNNHSPTSSRTTPSSSRNWRDKEKDDGPWGFKPPGNRPPIPEVGIGPSQVSSEDLPPIHPSAAEARRDGARTGPPESPLLQPNNSRFENRFDHEGRNEPAWSQRAIYDGPDRHVPRREPRGRPNEYARSGGPLPKVTGPNSVPIGSRRLLPNSVGGDSALPMQDGRYHPPPPQSQLSDGGLVPESPRNSKPRLPLPPGKESYERPTHSPVVDTYRPDPPEIPSHNQNRRREGPPSYHPENPEPGASVAKNLPRDKPPFQRERSRFDQPLQDSAPRIWVEAKRDPPSARAVYPPPGDERQSATPPPLSRESSTTSPVWQSSESSSQFAPRQPNQSRPPPPLRRRSRGPQDHPPPANEAMRSEPLRRPEPDVRSNGQHERYPETPKAAIYPPPNAHPEMQSPPVRRQTRPERPRQDVAPASHPLSERRSRWGEPLPVQEPVPPVTLPARPEEQERKPGTVDRYEPHYTDGGVDKTKQIARGPPPHVAKPELRIRGQSNFANDSPPGEEQHRDREYDINRPPYPPNSRRLLDRLSFDAPENIAPPQPLPPPPGEHVPQSLRDRVQIPEKRDRNEFVNREYVMDTSYDADDGGPLEPATKRARKRAGRPRRGRRGGA